MPIIEKWQVPGLDYTPPRLPHLPADYTTAEQATAIGKIGSQITDELSTIAGQRAHAAARLESDARRGDVAVAFDALKNKIMTSPLRQRKLAGGEGEDPEAAAFLPSTPIPKSETMMEDWNKGAEAIRKQALEGTDALTAQYLKGHVLLMYSNATKTMQDLKMQSQQHEMLASVQRGIDVIHNEVGATPADQYMTMNKNGTAVFTTDPAQSSSFQNAKRLITNRIGFAEQNGLRPDAAEQMRRHELAFLAKNWAEKQMRLDPAAWAQSVEAGTNLWGSEISDTQQAHLKTQADAAVTKTNAAEHKKILDAREKEEQALGDMLLEKTLTTQAIKERRNLTGDQKATWEMKRVAQDHAWEGNAAVERQMSIEANAADAGYRMQDKLNLLLRDKQISDAAHTRLSAVIRANIHRNQDIAREEGTKAYNRWKEDFKTLLTPSPALAFDKPEIHGVWAGALDDMTARMKGRPDGDLPKVIDEIRQHHLGRLGDQLEGMRDAYNKGLTKPMEFKQDGSTDPNAKKDAVTAAYERWKVDPKQGAAMRRSGTFPSGLSQELDSIDKTIEYNGYVAKARKKP
jgi:hypothetical protein